MTTQCIIKYYNFIIFVILFGFIYFFLFCFSAIFEQFLIINHERYGGIANLEIVWIGTPVIHVPLANIDIWYVGERRERVGACASQPDHTATQLLQRVGVSDPMN